MDNKPCFPLPTGAPPWSSSSLSLLIIRSSLHHPRTRCHIFQKDTSTKGMDHACLLWGAYLVHWWCQMDGQKVCTGLGVEPKGTMMMMMMPQGGSLERKPIQFIISTRIQYTLFHFLCSLHLSFSCAQKLCWRLLGNRRLVHPFHLATIFPPFTTWQWNRSWFIIVVRTMTINESPRVIQLCILWVV